MSFCAPFASGGVITFQRYYKFCADIMISDDCFPYIVKNNSVYWNIPYTQVTIGDFINTHKLADGDVLYMESGFPMAGGAGWQDIETVWNAAWPTIKAIGSSIVCLTGFLSSITTLLPWVKENLFKKADKPPVPHQFFEFVLSEKSWNHRQLAEKLQISTEDAKQWLKALKYHWDAHTGTYVITDAERAEDLDLISRVAYSDI